MSGINIFFQYRGAAKCGDDWGGMVELRPVTYLVFATVENQESQNESSDDADGLNGDDDHPQQRIVDLHGRCTAAFT